MHCPTRKQELQEIFRQSCQGNAAQEEAALADPTAVVGLLVKVPRMETAGLKFLLTLRSENVRSHAGQVCLPGGLVEESDGGNLLAALDREFQEEIGVAPGQIEWEARPWGQALSRFGVQVFPHLGFISEEDVKELTLQDSEVADAAWLPLEKLLDTSEWGERTLVEEASDAEGLYGVSSFPVWFGWKHTTWGLTACFLLNFMRRISGARPIE